MHSVMIVYLREMRQQATASYPTHSAISKVDAVDLIIFLFGHTIIISLWKLSTATRMMFMNNDLGPNVVSEAAQF